MNKKVYLVNIVLPVIGMKLAVEEYRQRLLNVGYRRRQVAGSFGGSKTGRLIDIENGIVYRVA